MSPEGQYSVGIGSCRIRVYSAVARKMFSYWKFKSKIRGFGAYDLRICELLIQANSLSLGRSVLGTAQKDTYVLYASIFEFYILYFILIIWKFLHINNLLSYKIFKKKHMCSINGINLISQRCLSCNFIASKWPH